MPHHGRIFAQKTFAVAVAEVVAAAAVATKVAAGTDPSSSADFVAFALGSWVVVVAYLVLAVAADRTVHLVSGSAVYSADSCYILLIFAGGY